MTNWYTKAIYAEDEEDRLEAMQMFLQEEIEKMDERLDGIDLDEGNPDEATTFSYTKGRLDYASLMLTMVFQTRFAQSGNGRSSGGEE